MKPYRISAGFILMLVIGIVLSILVRHARAQAPTPDSYEENDTLAAAALIPVGSELGNLSVSPANDSDWFRVLVSPSPTTPGTYRIELVATPGLDLTLNLYDPNALLVLTHNDPGGPNAGVTFSASNEGYYAVEVLNATSAEGWYLLRVLNLTLPSTPTPLPTETLAPTATSPFTTHTPTPNLGGLPDFSEPNYDFARAYRIAPGDELTGLNFNSGQPGMRDNDFFVMGVRGGARYTCETEDLGPGVDTNLIVYHSPHFNDVVGGNDDQDISAGQINSSLTFTARADGDVFLLVGYKYPEGDLRYPGAGTYTLTCFVPTLPTAVPAAAGVSSDGLSHATPVSILTILEPLRDLTPTPITTQTLTLDVIVAYDANANREAEPDEGVSGLHVQVVDAATQQPLAYGATNPSGAVRLTVATRGIVRIVIPLLGLTQEFRPGSPALWTQLIPASIVPAIIP